MGKVTTAFLGLLLCVAPVSRAGIVVTLKAIDVDPNNLKVGQEFDVTVSLSADQGTIEHIRVMQLDHLLTSGSEVLDYRWDIDGINAEFYFLDGYPEKRDQTTPRAIYTEVEPFEGFILNLTDEPNLIGFYSVKFEEPGELNLLGVVDPENKDLSIRFESGFGNIIRYTQADGNVSGGILALTPEPGTLCLLAAGGIAIIGRRRRRLAS